MILRKLINQIVFRRQKKNSNSHFTLNTKINSKWIRVMKMEEGEKGGGSRGRRDATRMRTWRARPLPVYVKAEAVGGRHLGKVTRMLLSS